MTERDLFLSALSIADRDARAAFLAERCGDGPELRRKVEELLAAHAEAGSFLEPNPGTAGVPPAPEQTSDLPPAPPTADPQSHLPATSDHHPTECVGTHIGPYRLLQKLGEGGMGTVWVAEQSEPVKRRVALKVIKPGMDSARVVARFEAERQALALMDHTSIAKVFDGGTFYPSGGRKPPEFASGVPYFVMELVKGVPITAYCDELHLSIRDRLGLFVQVCATVQHAHQKGVIHRDIKPSNVLVAVQDGRPVPKVIDFGVAKAVGARLTDETMYTELGAVIGTLEYMAPEQAELSALDVDTRADVYALGVLLFELLTGTTPLTRSRLKAAGFAAMLRAIKEVESPKPSTRLAESKESLAGLAAARRTDPKRLTREVRGELDWIVLRALEKDRTRRYETANGLSRDVGRYLADEPVEAGPPSGWYRVRKFVRRNRGQVTAAALVFLAVLLGVAGTTWQVAERRRDREVAAARSRQAVVSALDQAEATLRADKLPEADAAIGVAERELPQANAPDLADRLATARKDRAMLDRLRDIFEQGWAIPIDGDCGGCATGGRGTEQYASAFREYGLAVGAEPPQRVRDELRRSVIVDALLAGLSDWFFRDPAQDGLRGLVDAADPHPYRSAVRAAVAANDEPRVRSLTAQADAAGLPPGFAVALGMHSALKEDGLGLRLMKAAWLTHPDYYPLARQIGSRLYWDGMGGDSGKATEAVTWLRTAAALRPGRPVEYVNLAANWMNLRGDAALGEFEAAIRKAIRLGHSTAEAHAMLGFILIKQRDLAGAEAAFRDALAADPSYYSAQAGLVLVLFRNGDLGGAAAAMNRLEQLGDTASDSLAAYSAGVVAGLESSLVVELIPAGLSAQVVRYYAERFEKRARAPVPSDPKSVPDSELLWAAWAAAQAGTGHGKEVLPPSERPAIRRKGRGWLNDSLAQWNRAVTADPTANRNRAHQEMTEWLATPHLSPVRDEAELAKLPADEVAEWRRLWADVRVLRDRTAPPEVAPPPRPANRP